VLLSDRDIRSEITAGRVAVEPFEEAMIQPSSVDVRLDKFFRVFENHKYSVIDPSIEQAELTREVIAEDGEAFICTQVNSFLQAPTKSSPFQTILLGA
jgi:dCTP deaminase